MKKIVGIVVSDKMEKSAVISVSRWIVHPLYKKRFLRHKKYHVGNDLGAKIGDQVEVTEGRPMSKTKRWKITKIISQETNLFMNGGSK